MTEAELMRRIQHRNSHSDIRLFRNNVGLAMTPDGSPIRYGLCTGSSDLVGWKTVIITPDMVGKKLAQFVAIEVKTTTKLSPEQAKFLEQVNKMGGIGKVLYSEDEQI
jgi:hypothetical protein